MKEKKIPTEVKDKIMGYPKPYRKKILTLRKYIFETVKESPDIGLIVETLKWREPSYLPTEKNIGTTIRLAWLKSKPNQYGIYFNCQTTLIKKFKFLFGEIFSYEGNRAIIFNLDQELPKPQLKICIEMALTYHLKKKKKK